MKIDRQRLLDILITALVGAGIAFLQALISGLVGSDLPVINPEVAMISSGAVKYGLAVYRG